MKTPDISIHSPHARGDFLGKLFCRRSKISIHSPHARGDADNGARYQVHSHFNPLPSCEGRQGISVGRVQSAPNFNPLPSCEGRP